MFCVLQSQITALSLFLTLWNSATPDPALRVRVPGLRWPVGCLGHCTLTPYTLMPPDFSALCLLPAPVSRPLNSRSLVHWPVRGSYILIHSGSTILEISRNSTLQWMPNPVGFHILMDVYLIFILSESFYWQSLIGCWIFERIMHFPAMSLNFHVEEAHLCHLPCGGQNCVNSFKLEIALQGEYYRSEYFTDRETKAHWGHKGLAEQHTVSRQKSLFGPRW